MNRGTVLKLFHSHRDRLIRELGRQALDSDQINEVGRREFRKRWGGVYDQSTWQPQPNRFYVVNTARTVNSPGYHWVGIYVSPSGIATAYDSFGRNVHKLLFVANHTAKKLLHHTLQGTDPKPEQRGRSQVCGDLSLAFLLTVRDLGVRAVAGVV